MQTAKLPQKKNRQSKNKQIWRRFASNLPSTLCVRLRIIESVLEHANTEMHHPVIFRW